MKTKVKIIIVLFLGGIMLLSAIPLSFAQLNRGMLENMLEDDDTKNCEIISFQDSMFVPLRIAISYPTTPNTSIPVSGSNPETQFSADITNENFFFWTESLDQFNIKMNLEYENPSTTPRYIYYEIFTRENVLTQVGSWQETDKDICRILSVFTTLEPHINTDEEIVAIVNEDNIKRDTVTQNLIQGVLDLIAIVAIVGTAVGLTFIIYIIMMRISKHNDLRKTQLVTKQFINAVNKFDIALKNMKMYDEYNGMKIDQIIETIKTHFRDVLIATSGLVNEKKKINFSNLKPEYMQTSDDKVEQGISLLEKVKDTVFDQLDIKNKPVKPESIKEKYEKMTDEDLRADFDKFREKSIKDPSNEEYRMICKLITDMIKERCK